MAYVISAIFVSLSIVYGIKYYGTDEVTPTPVAERHVREPLILSSTYGTLNNGQDARDLGLVAKTSEQPLIEGQSTFFGLTFRTHELGYVLSGIPHSGDWLEQRFRISSGGDELYLTLMIRPVHKLIIHDLELFVDRSVEIHPFHEMDRTQSHQYDSELPEGLEWDGQVITGTPTKEGIYACWIKCSCSPMMQGFQVTVRKGEYRKARRIPDSAVVKGTGRDEVRQFDGGRVIKHVRKQFMPDVWVDKDRISIGEEVNIRIYTSIDNIDSYRISGLPAGLSVIGDSITGVCMEPFGSRRLEVDGYGVGNLRVHGTIELREGDGGALTPFVVFVVLAAIAFIVGTVLTFI